MRLKLLLLVVLLCVPAWVQAARTILVFGDSLSAGYGLPQRAGWVTLLDQQLARDGYDYGIINVSISGETTVGGKNRIERTVRRYRPDVTIVELGANDGLRGARLSDIRRHLSAIIEVCQRYGTKVLLVGMRIPPNYGREYSEGFHDIFSALARQHDTALVPFMLEGFADKRELFQRDGFHPDLKAQPLVLENIYAHLKPLLSAR